ncbi:hypothetical protein KI688_002176 [Linnemannia hyalina]|uniref:Uncharacterized protein n=1 Tax=Linnemannia hyalina TaxID=64524 RepID=A0A9P7XTY3_9FUNG|nr:hypothetical protein KI688_002176 [Linnemannia hyalina]
MSFPTRRVSVSTKRKGTATSSKVSTGHRDIRGSFASPEPQDTKQQSSSTPQPAQPRQTKPFPETSPEDPNILISITQHHQSTHSTPPVVSPSRLTRKRVKQQREQESKPPSIGNPTPPTLRNTKRRNSQAQPPILDNVTTRWRHLTRGIPAPDELGESKATESKSRKLTDCDTTMTIPFGAPGQKTVTPSAPVGGNEKCFGQDGPNETMGLHQIESKSSTSRTKKTATRGQR